jgi:hypothetical protein
MQEWMAGAGEACDMNIVRRWSARRTAAGA